jgi:ribonucleoside-diphosphate reductase alpha chain
MNQLPIEVRYFDIKITNSNNEVIFQKDNFEIPKFWSDRAATIMASKYAMNSEYSAIQIIHRVANQITEWGESQGYFMADDEREKFRSSLVDILINQRAAFNSPVWFNVGADTGTKQCSACFVLPVEDNMESILGYAKDSGMIFKGGSGVGVNVSKLRAKGELLSNRGFSSGPVSFMRMWDSVGGCIKSGGKVRRAASLICMDVDHPDIMEFIECKATEERKAKILVANGIDPEEAYTTVRFQNANHSVRITDEFMKQIVSKTTDSWKLTNRGDKNTARTLSASEIMHKIAEIAWETGDPGVQFHDRMNKDNPVPSMGKIVSTNPCSEFSAINSSSCNLASLNLAKYIKGNGLDAKQFAEDIGILITAMDILIESADYPTDKIRETTVATRPLGLGFTNQGAYLILLGLPYDSEYARKHVSEITRIMTYKAYSKSTELAKRLGSFQSFSRNKTKCIEIAKRLVYSEDDRLSDNIESMIDKNGLRNSQLTLIAPTGTISYIMDCDTTGIEPLYALEATKHLAGGGIIKVVPQCVESCVGSPAIEAIAKLLPEKQRIYDTANDISADAHLQMMAACQQHLNGSISKTVNLPSNATVEDVEYIYTKAWKLGLKSIIVYRDGCKQMQPLTITSHTAEESEADEYNEKWIAVRRRLPDTRHSITHKFNIQGFEGYFIVSSYQDNGNMGEIFIYTQKQGSTFNGLMDSFATAISLGLQYGVPLEVFCDKFIGSKFEPDGITTNEDIRMTTSIMDYIFRWLRTQFIDEEDDDPIMINMPHATKRTTFDGPPCSKCHAITSRNGTCYVCPQCGETTGCS